MGQTGNETKHNARDFKIRWNVIVIPVVLFLIILIAGIAIPDTFNAIVNKGVMLIMKDMGWFISLSTLFFVGFCLVIIDYLSIRLFPAPPVLPPSP